MITTEDIEKLAKLARIRLPEGEAKTLSTEMDAILEYVKQVENISGDTTNEPQSIRNVLREDVVTHTDGQYTESILANAPSRNGNYLMVKKIL